jgi:cobalt-zinc-cadmium efflux system outer membrane protein
MAYPEKLAILLRPVPGAKAAVCISAVLIGMLSQGCSAQLLDARGPENGSAPSQLPACEEPGHPSSNDHTTNSGEEEVSEHGKKEVDEHEAKAENPQAKLKITLPMAIEMCIHHNFRVLAGTARIGVAEAGLITASLVPNPSLFSDCELIPLRRADIINQLGPPQWDTLVAFPIDWLLFGKRLAAMHAARLGIEVAGADFENTLRIQVAQTVDAFYEVLMDDAYFKLAEKNLEELRELEKIIQDLARNKKVGGLDVDRIQLAVLEAVLERHDRELALELAKARLRPFIGRTAADADYDVAGDLTVTAVVPPPKLPEAVALAEAHRPDLLSGRKAIAQAKAVVELERRKAKPNVAVQPGWSYQDQAHQTTFHNGSMLDIGIIMTLPLTDRNQGNIRKAKAEIHERQFTYEGDRADALAEVEASRASYEDAVEHLTQFNKPETLKAAQDLRKNMEAAYRAGDRKLIEMLDAQTAYRDRLAHVIEFQSDYWRTLNRLNAAVGLKAYDPEKGATEPVGKNGDKKE